MTASGPVHHPIFLFLLVFKVKIPECFLLIENLSTPQNPCFGGWYDGYPRDFSGNVVGGKKFRMDLSQKITILQTLSSNI